MECKDDSETWPVGKEKLALCWAEERMIRQMYYVAVTGRFTCIELRKTRNRIYNDSVATK